jgi:retron-type reverse transcriptase
LSSQNILYDRQFGFRKSHSTSHALNHSVTHIKKELEKKRYVLGIFIDLSKAFDTIDHEKLVYKLDHYGIRGNTKKLLKSYLSNRHQYTECLGEKSDNLEVEYGVPQGSVLGPLLFLVYINDIINCSAASKALEFVLFADDTNIFVSGKNH